MIAFTDTSSDIVSPNYVNNKVFGVGQREPSLPSVYHPAAFASDADIKLPDLKAVTFSVNGGSLSGMTILYFGLLVCLFGVAFGLVQYFQTKSLPVHKQMAFVSNTIWETCKTYLAQQGKFLAYLWVLIAACMAYYFLALEHKDMGSFILILVCSILGILGSYGVAWFGIRINTVANSRTAFSSLQGNALNTLLIPLKSGMSVGPAAGQRRVVLHDFDFGLPA